MKFLLWILAAIALLTVRCHAADDPKGVSEDARHEIARRGHMAIQTGTIRGGLVESALAPPADDSGKWFLILIGKQGDKGFEQVKEAIAHSKEMAAWVNAAEPARSFMHYQVRLIDDGTQQDWLAGIRPTFEKFGLPMIVVQPPRNGRFGDPKTTVKGIHGVISGADLATKLRDALGTYVQALEVPIQSGISQTVGVSPPFNSPPPQQPAAPAAPVSPAPFEWPPAAPIVLTIDQIKAACPGATPVFLIEVLDAKQTDLEKVKLLWLIHQQQHPPAKVEPVKVEPLEVVPAREVVEERVAENPSEPASSKSLEMLAFLMMGCVAGAIGQRIWTILESAIGKRVAVADTRTIPRTSPTIATPQSTDLSQAPTITPLIKSQ